MDLTTLNEQIIGCQRCPRLRAWCAQVAEQKRAAYRDEVYWGKPVPNLLPTGRAETARLLVVGLAPAAHGANRTGRMFTGDRSGDFLFRAMHEAGFANQAEARRPGDGLTLNNAVITAAAHCAPPQNKPTAEELAHCRSWLERTVDALPALRVVVCLGQTGLQAMLRLYRDRGLIRRLKDVRFGHAVEHALPGGPTLLCSFHPSQQNTFTGRLTPEMLRAVFERAQAMIRGEASR